MGCITLFLFPGSAISFAQNGNVNTDTLQREQKEYEVHESRPYNFTSGIRIVEISPVTFQTNASISGLSDALQQVGGVYMRSYGNGMNNAVTLRGFGPERTSTLWNGIPLSNPGLGQLDMNLMPGAFFNSIRLIEGSSSTQYGSGAQGGSLILEYTPTYSKPFDLFVQQEYGSFFTWNTALQTNYGTSNFQGRTAFLRNSSSNNYAYRDKSVAGFPTRETVNGEFVSYQGMQDLFFKLKRNWHVSVHGWYSYADRNIPPAMGSVNNNSRQVDQSIRTMIQVRKVLREHEFKLQVAYIQDQLHFSSTALIDSSTIHTGQAQLQYAWKPRKRITLMAGGIFSIHHSEYKFYGAPVDELRGSAFVLFRYGGDSELGLRKYRRRFYFNLSAGIRQQFSSHYISYPSGHLGVEHKIHLRNGHAFIFAGAVNSSYRMPTLNDLFWVPGGDPNLKPEYSWNLENSYKYEFTRKASSTSSLSLTIDALGYFGRTHNWIQWAPTALGYWIPKNLTEVQSAGFEGGAQFTYSQKKWKLKMDARYNFTHTTDIHADFAQLIYVPQHTVKGSIVASWNEVYLQVVPQFYSKRFTLADNSLSIPPFFLLNVQAGYTLKLTACNIGFYCRIANATHAEYQMVVNRPMPGIHFNAGINFYLHTLTLKHKHT